MITFAPRSRRAYGELRTLSAVRFLASVNNFNLRTSAPVGATHVEIEAIGGGASGVSLRRVAGNQSAHGGAPGLVHRRRFALADLLEIGDVVQVLIGAGGVSTSPSQDLASATGAANRPGGSSYVRPLGHIANYVFASGGPSYWTQNTYYPTPADLLGAMYADYTPNLPGAGYVQQLVNNAPSAPPARGASAGVSTRGPGAGGGSSDASNGGDGGIIRRYFPHETTNAGAGLEPGTYGAGGRGGGRDVAGTAGFAPGGGGGGGFGAASGAGASGAVDFYFLGVSR